MNPSPPSKEEIRSVARRVTGIFEKYELRCCLFGSAAGSLFGASRTPNDIDVVVFTKDYDQEELKQILVNEDEAKFFRVDSRNPLARYQVLWYTLPPSKNGTPRACKVDLLVPGVLNIPHVPRAWVERVGGLPVMPLVPLILLKLQGWSDHRVSHRTDMQAKQHVDVDDLKELLYAATRIRGKTVWQADVEWMPRSLIDDAQKRVDEFIQHYPDFANGWERLGFSV